MPPTCAILIHSTSRDAARPFWPLILRGVDRHFPPQRCSFYFSTDAEDAELRALMRSLRTPPTLLVRSSDASHGWAASLLEDLKLIREPWVFHLADDVLLPDPISVWSIDAILDVAQRHNASLITLHNESFNIWFGGSPKLYSQRLVDNSSISVRRGVSSLEFYRPSIGHTKPSRYVVNQQFSLFQTRSLTALLEAVPGNTTPQEWEGLYNHKNRARESNMDILSRALAVRYLSGDALNFVLEVGHAGLVRRGWGLCLLQHMAIQVGLHPASFPIAPLPLSGKFTWSQRHPLEDRFYAFCRTRAPNGGVAASPKNSCLELVSYGHYSLKPAAQMNACEAEPLMPLASRPPGCDCDRASTEGLGFCHCVGGSWVKGEWIAGT